MFYLKNEQFNIDTSNRNYLYITKEQKISYINNCLTDCTPLQNILYKIYPEMNNTSTYGTIREQIDNTLLLGLSVQICITIIENPNIICSTIRIPCTPLDYNIRNIHKVLQCVYNGNYCILLGTSISNQIVYKKILLDEVNTQFIPSVPEYSISDSDYAIQFFKNTQKFYFGVVFIEDADIKNFLNCQLGKINTLYVTIKSTKYLRYMSFLSKQFNVVYLIHIKEFEISDYSKLSLRLSRSCICIFLNIGSKPFYNGTFTQTLAENRNFLIDKDLDISNIYKNHQIDWKTFGVIIKNNSFYMGDKKSYKLNAIDAFRELRKAHGLPVFEDAGSSQSLDLKIPKICDI